MRSLRITTLDWYIIRKFIGTYFFAILLIIGISVVFDVAEKLDDFLNREAPLKAIIFDYYLNFIPYFANLFSSLFVFISVIFITSQMATRSEIIAILSSGISFNRLLYPYFLSALFLFILSLLLSNFVIPSANKTRIAFENVYVSYVHYSENRNIHKQVRPGLFVYLQSYSPYSQTGYKLAVEHFEGTQLLSKLWADVVQWDSVNEKWHLDKYYIRTYHDTCETLTKGQGLDTTLYLTPKEFGRTIRDMEMMNYFELNDYIDLLALQGAADINGFYVEKYTRIATPFSVFILTLIGVSVSSRKVRGGMGKNLGLGLALSFLYILFMRFSTMFAIGGTLPPLLSMWLPNIIFAEVAYMLYRRAPK